MGRRLLEDFARNMEANGGSLFFTFEENLELIHTLDSHRVPFFIPCPPPEGSVLHRVWEERKPLLIRDILKDSSVKGSGWSGYRDCSLLAFPLLGSSGELLGIVTLHNKSGPPFTEQDLELGMISASLSSEVLLAHRATEALAESETRFRHLIENGGDLVGIVGADLRIRYISPNIEKVLGYTQEEWEGQSALDFIHPKDKVRIGSLFFSS